MGCDSTGHDCSIDPLVQLFGLWLLENTQLVESVIHAKQIGKDTRRREDITLTGMAAPFPIY